jgi:hypothetical protein
MEVEMEATVEDEGVEGEVATVYGGLRLGGVAG